MYYFRIKHVAKVKQTINFIFQVNITKHKKLNMVHYLPNVPLFCTTSPILLILYILVRWVIQGCWMAKKKFQSPWMSRYLAIYEGR